MYLNQNHATKCVEAGFYHWVKEETHCDTRNHAHCQCELNAPWAFDGFHVCIFRNWCEVAFAYQTEIVVNGYHAKEQGYNSKHEVTGFGERLLIPTYFFMSVEPVANSTWVAAINAPMLAKA